MATAKGLCFAIERPLVTVSSLAALAMEGRAGIVLPLLDAKKNEVYAGLYRLTGPDSAPEPLVPDAVLPPARLEAWARRAAGDAPVVVVGDGALAYPAEAARAGQVLEGARGTPAASHIVSLAERRLAGGVSDELVVAVPRYIRASEAEIKFPDGIFVDRSKPPS
jgi:tRNA threonylcarbamoyladenosine biosynthesis protein TsaB